MRPLYIGRFTSIVNGSWGKGSGRKGETATARTTEGILGVPVRRILGSEASFESELKLDDGCGGVLNDEGTGEIGDGVSESDGDRGRHFEDDYKRRKNCV